MAMRSSGADGEGARGGAAVICSFKIRSCESAISCMPPGSRVFIQRIIDEHGMPKGPRRPLQLAVEPSYKPTPQPAGIPITVGGRPVAVG